MLIKCPECELQVSDKAISCPHCGYPMQPAIKTIARTRTKRKRLPNGFGQISEIKNRNLRNPFRVMVTVGIDQDTGRPICKPLKPVAYFKTYNEAYEALISYNRNPFEMNTEMRIRELYQKWYDNRVESSVADSTLRQYTAAWNIVQKVENVRVKDLKISHIKGCIDLADTPNGKRMIKILFNLMLDYAVEFDLVDKNISRQYVSHNLYNNVEPRKEHIPYSEEELQRMRENLNISYGIDLMLIQCYTGMRPQEIGLIKLSDFNLDRMYFRGGLKTADGRNRVIPIHSGIQDLVMAKYHEALELKSEYLFNYTRDYRGGVPRNYFLSYSRYKTIVQNAIKYLGLNTEHKGHDGRKTFVTLAKENMLDEYAIKRIVGHHISDITERIYTERDIAWLKAEIEKIKIL